MQKNTAEFLSNPELKLTFMRAPWIKAFVLVTWSLFVAEIFLFPARHIFLISYITDAAGVLGFGIAVAWLFLDRRWGYVCVAASIVLVVLYVARWLFLVQFVHSGASEPSVIIAIQRVIQVWGAEFARDTQESGLGSALLVQYWNVIMAFVQVLVIAIILLRDRSKDKTVKGGSV
jgi:hypothetical protein